MRDDGKHGRRAESARGRPRDRGSDPGRDPGPLLDFEWARYGEPVDDWFFLARFSGPHRETVLEVIAGATTTPLETLRAECEVREAAYLAADLRSALEHPMARRAWPRTPSATSQNSSSSVLGGATRCDARGRRRQVGGGMVT